LAGYFHFFKCAKNTVRYQKARPPSAAGLSSARTLTAYFTRAAWIAPERSLLAGTHPAKAFPKKDNINARNRTVSSSSI
jgi:hypothetical protein